MKVLVAIKRVLDYRIKPRIKADESGIDLANAKTSMNPFDEIGVEEAVRLGEPRVWLLYGPLILSSLVLFVSFYAAGLRMAIKNRVQAHKRLIIVASAIGLGAGFFRLILFQSGFHPLSLPIGVLACSVFIFAGVFYDWFTRRSVHSVYWIGLVVMFAVEVSLLPQVSEADVAWVNQWLAALGEQVGFLYSPEPTAEF